MNNHLTPETDAFAIRFKTTCGEKYWAPVDIARKLERERNEAREGLAEEIKFHHRTHSEMIQTQCQMQDFLRERDEAREKLSAAWQSLRDSQDEVLRLTFENRELRKTHNE